MPMPMPRDGETRDDFMDRCMGDDAMNDDYPDGKQRAAVCNANWRKAHGGEKPDKDSVRGRRTIRVRYEAILDASSRIDVEAGVAYGVKLNSNTSLNKVRYRDDVLERATHLYEGAKTYDDHFEEMPFSPRKRKSLLGRLVNVRFSPGGHRADWHVLPSKREILRDAKADSAIFGFSHNVVVDIDDKPDSEGFEVVLNIVEVLSVDLVSDPATTRGLFEGRRVRLGAAEDEREADVAEEGAKVEKLLQEKIDKHEAEIKRLEGDLRAAQAEAATYKAAAEGLKKDLDKSRIDLAKAEGDLRATRIEAEIAAAGFPEESAALLRDSLKDVAYEAARKIVDGAKKLVAAPKEPPPARSEGKVPPAKKGEIAEEEMLAAFRN